MVMRGVLGWGNRKAGLEAYGPGGRWMKFADGYGDLLGDALEREGGTEGADLIVVVVPRGVNGDRSLLDHFTGEITELVEARFP